MKYTLILLSRSSLAVCCLTSFLESDLFSSTKMFRYGLYGHAFKARSCSDVCSLTFFPQRDLFSFTELFRFGL